MKAELRARFRHSAPAVAPEQLQRDFYAATADRYDQMHVHADDEHYVALSFISAMVDGYGYGQILDVGAGTGRGVKHLIDKHPAVEVAGVEPVRAMIDTAERINGVPAGVIVEAGGDPLPYSDRSFDAVCELGILHHVSDPNAIVSEMTRVARRAVFLSDGNRFAGGGGAHRAAKYALYMLRLWPAVYRAATGGRGYALNQGDGGVAYSYSVYDSLQILNEWADRVFLVPTTAARTSWFHPLFSARTVLLCAIRDQH
ncbi:MAG: class I SAM-dependent methyltransferase [Solirubrobacteraceae bacterium]